MNPSRAQLSILICVCQCFLTAGWLTAQSISEDTAWSATGKEIVITGQFIPTETKNTVNTVKIIKYETIQKRGATSLDEILSNEANIRISYDPVLGSVIGINGMGGENLKIMIDGVPVIGRENGNINASLINVDKIRQIEIIEGAQSLIYGSDASAGVINILTFNTQVHPTQVSTHTLFEYNGFHIANLSIGQQWKNALLQINGGVEAFSPVHDADQRFQNWLPHQQKDLQLGLNYHLDNGLKFKLTGHWMNNKTENLDSIHRKMFRPYAYDQYYYTTRKDLALITDYALGKNFYFQATNSINTYKKRKDVFRYDVDKDTSAVLTNLQDTSYNTAIFNRLTFAGSNRSGTLRFLTGADHTYETLHGQRVNDTTAAIANVVSKGELGLLVNVIYSPVRGLQITGGTRWIYSKLSGKAWTPSFSVRYTLSDAIVFKASYAVGYRSPGLKEMFFNFIDNNHHIIGNTLLRPEHSNNILASVEYTLPEFRNITGNIILSGFYNKVSDQIDLADLGGSYSYINIHQMKTRGGRIGLTLQNEFISFQSIYAYTGYFNVLSREQNIPASLWSGDWVNNLSITPPKWPLSFTVWTKLTGDTPYYFYNEKQELTSSFSKGWMMLNASIQYKPRSQQISFTAGVKNLLDRRTTELVNAGSVSPHGSSSKVRDIHWGRTLFIQTNFNLNGTK